MLLSRHDHALSISSRNDLMGVVCTGRRLREVIPRHTGAKRAAAPSAVAAAVEDMEGRTDHHALFP